MADTMFFLKLDGITGESQDADHSGELDILTVADSITNAGTYDIGTGGNTGKALFSDIAITKYVDCSSPVLRQYCALGTAIGTATFSINKQAGENKLEYLKITLQNAVVTSIQFHGSGGSTEPMQESMTLNFAGIIYEYKQQSNTGGAANTITFGRDIQKNQNIS